MATTPSTLPGAPAPEHAKHTVTITLKDGSTATHTAEAIRYWFESDGACVVEASCCGMEGGPCPKCSGFGCSECSFTGKTEDTRSRHTFYDPARAVADPTATHAVIVDPESEVRAHVQRVAEHHAAIHRARSFTLESLMRPPKPQPGA